MRAAAACLGPAVQVLRVRLVALDDELQAQGIGHVAGAAPHDVSQLARATGRSEERWGGVMPGGRGPAQPPPPTHRLLRAQLVKVGLRQYVGHNLHECRALRLPRAAAQHHLWEGSKDDATRVRPAAARAVARLPDLHRVVVLLWVPLLHRAEEGGCGQLQRTQLHHLCARDGHRPRPEPGLQHPAQLKGFALGCVSVHHCLCAPAGPRPLQQGGGGKLSPFPLAPMWTLAKRRATNAFMSENVMLPSARSFSSWDQRGCWRVQGRSRGAGVTVTGKLACAVGSRGACPPPVAGSDARGVCGWCRGMRACRAGTRRRT